MGKTSPGAAVKMMARYNVWGTP